MADEPEPRAEEIVAILFRAAMSGDRDRYANEHDLDPKLLEMWTFTQAANTSRIWKRSPAHEDRAAPQ